MRFRDLVLLTCASAILMARESTIVVKADGVPQIVAGTSNLPPMDVVDIASYQGDLSVTDFQTMRNDGVKGVVVKLTEGQDYVNPYAAEQIKNAISAGMVVSVYHYANYSSPEVARQEADYFINHAQQLGLNNTTLVVDDLEDKTTESGNVTANAMAFNQQLKDRGYINTGLYTGPSYIRRNQLDTSFIDNKRIWIAQWLYEPSAGDLRNREFGMWQWNNQTVFPGVKGQFDVSTDYSGMATNSPAGLTGYIQDLNDGRYYWLENGQRYTGFRYYMGAYYWFADGVRQDNSWHEAWGNRYYTGSDGRAVQGQQDIDGTWYEFGSDGTFYLRGYSSGYLYTPNISTANGGWNWIENGQPFTGFRYYMGTYYWFDKGVRQNTGWRSAWGLVYYTGEDGRALQGDQYIDGSWYNFGYDGTYYLR